MSRFFRTNSALAKVVLKNLKGKSKSSQEWLLRQLSDPYVEKARMNNYRCRSAFKLLEIDEKFKLLKEGDVVIDIGAAPGSWTQIAVDRTNAKGDRKLQKGLVLSVDLLHFHRVEGALSFGGMDFTKPETQVKLKEILNGQLTNCILSDMAPNATGIRMLDQENIINLCYSVLRFALPISAVGANLVVKVWNNGDVSNLHNDLSKFYAKVKTFKPKSSRSESAELFLIATGFKGVV